MATCTTIHLPTVLHFQPGSLATNQHFNMKLLTLSKGWCLFESTSTQGLICHIEECCRVTWVDFTAKGTRLNGRRKYNFFKKNVSWFFSAWRKTCVMTWQQLKRSNNILENIFATNYWQLVGHLLEFKTFHLNHHSLP